MSYTKKFILCILRVILHKINEKLRLRNRCFGVRKGKIRVENGKMAIQNHKNV